MTDLAVEQAKALQRDVQRLLGRCMLRLQQYERLLKAMIAEHEISVSIRDFEAVRAARVESSARKTLGVLVGEFLGSYLVSTEKDALPEMADEGADAPPSISVRVQVELSEEDLARTQLELRDLVHLRNNLVHHLIEQHDLWTAEGCRLAQTALDAAYEQIDQSYGRILELAKDRDRARQQFYEFVQSETYRNLVVHGIAPDGTVDWPSSSLVSGFREAARALAGDKGKWVSVAEAGKWLVEKYPDQSPGRFGCKTWQQALQESRLFDLRHGHKGGRRVICFKERANPKVTDAPERTWEFTGNGPTVQKP